MQIIWARRAESSYMKIRKQICNQFSEKEEATFVRQVFETISTIENFPEAFPETSLKRVKLSRKALIHPHSTLFYRIESKKRIRLLLFWDNRKDPQMIK